MRAREVVCGLAPRRVEAEGLKMVCSDSLNFWVRDRVRSMVGRCMF